MNMDNGEKLKLWKMLGNIETGIENLSDRAKETAQDVDGIYERLNTDEQRLAQVEKMQDDCPGLIAVADLDELKKTGAWAKFVAPAGGTVGGILAGLIVTLALLYKYGVL